MEINTNQLIPEEQTENKEQSSAEKLNANLIEESNPVATTEIEETKQIIDELSTEEQEDENQTALEEKYASMTKEQLTVEFEESYAKEDLIAIKKKVGLIRWAYNKHKNAETLLEKDKFVLEGGEEVNFQPTMDEIDVRFNEVLNKYKQSRKEREQIQEKERQDNLTKKLTILEEIKELINSEETLKHTYDVFKSLQEKWNNIGQVPPSELNNLLKNYHHHVEMFFDYVKLNKEMKDLDMRKNLDQKIELCEKTEELLLENSITESFKKLQEYHQVWKEIGPVPSDKKDEIWERFKTASDKLNERRREYYENLQQEQEQNLIRKTAFCEQVEQIAEMNFQNADEWEQKATEVMEIQKNWKAVGFAPKKYNDSIWRRFKNANDKFFEARNEYYKQLKSVRIENLNKKVALCEKAEALQNNTDWKNTTTEFLKMQEEWKTIGPVPQKQSDKIWARFRAACDNFFNAKSAHFSSRQEEQLANLKLKESLVEKVESFIFTEDNKENLDILKDYQRQWMEIGHVPVEHKDKLYKRFKTAIDSHFEKLSISNEERSNFKFRTKIDNLKEGPNANRQINQEIKFIANKLNTLKNDISIWENNMGFLANSKGSDLLKEQYFQKIEKAKKQIEELEKKLKMLKEI